MQIARRSLEQCEEIIERSEPERGQAYKDIRDGRLYREQGYSTFDEYCLQRWELSRRHVDRLINKAEMTSVFRPIGLKSPSTESQVRELMPLLRQDEQQVVEVWRELRELHGDRITAEKVREAVAQRLEKPEQLFDEYEANRQQILEANRQGACIEVPPAKNTAHVSYNSGNNEWYTPPEYIEAARRVMGNIDLDPASSKIANRIVGAARFFTAEDDGLCRHWAGRVWMNPPYAAELIGQFTQKLAIHFEAGDVTEALVLVNNATETNWFQTLLAQASAVCFVRQRVRFLDPQGNPGAPLQGQAILYLGNEPTIFAMGFAAFGTVLYGRQAAGHN